MEDADQCIKLNPTWEKAYFRKAAVFEAQDKHDEASWAPQQRPTSVIQTPAACLPAWAPSTRGGAAGDAWSCLDPQAGQWGSTAQALPLTSVPPPPPLCFRRAGFGCVQAGSSHGPERVGGVDRQGELAASMSEARRPQADGCNAARDAVLWRGAGPVGGGESGRAGHPAAGLLPSPHRSRASASTWRRATRSSSRPRRASPSKARRLQQPGSLRRWGNLRRPPPPPFPPPAACSSCHPPCAPHAPLAQRQLRHHALGPPRQRTASREGLQPTGPGGASTQPPGGPLRNACLPRHCRSGSSLHPSKWWSRAPASPRWSPSCQVRASCPAAASQPPRPAPKLAPEPQLAAFWWKANDPSPHPHTQHPHARARHLRALVSNPPGPKCRWSALYPPSCRRRPQVQVVRPLPPFVPPQAPSAGRPPLSWRSTSKCGPSTHSSPPRRSAASPPFAGSTAST